MFAQSAAMAYWPLATDLETAKTMLSWSSDGSPRSQTSKVGPGPRPKSIFSSLTIVAQEFWLEPQNAALSNCASESIVMSLPGMVTSRPTSSTNGRASMWSSITTSSSWPNGGSPAPLSSIVAVYRQKPPGTYCLAGGARNLLTAGTLPCGSGQVARNQAPHSFSVTRPHDSRTSACRSSSGGQTTCTRAPLSRWSSLASNGEPPDRARRSTDWMGSSLGVGSDGG